MGKKAKKGKKVKEVAVEEPTEFDDMDVHELSAAVSFVPILFHRLFTPNVCRS